MIVRELLIRVGFDFDKKDADEAEKKVDRISQLGRQLAGVFAINAIKNYMVGALDAASTAQDQFNVLNQVFGSTSDKVVSWAETQAKVMGRSKYSLMEYAGAMGSVLVPMLNGNREKAAEMSQGIAQLSVDLGSFFHKADDETMARLRSGLLGSTEAVDQLGINLRTDALAAHAATMGIKNFSAKTDEATKTAVRWSKILKDTKDKQGWAAKTADEYDNRVRALKENFKDLSVTIGLKLLPPAQAVVSVFAMATKGLSEMLTNSNMVTVALTALGGVLAMMAIRWTAMHIPLILTIAFLGALFLIVEDIYTSLEGGDGYFADFFKALAGKDEWENVIKTWKQGKQILDDIISGDWESASNRIFDFVNPNINATGDAEAMERANLALREHDMRKYGSGLGLTGAPEGTSYTSPTRNVTSAAAAHANQAGPWAGRHSTGVVININGTMAPATPRDIENATRRGVEAANRDLYRTTGRFNVTEGGTGIDAEGVQQ